MTDNDVEPPTLERDDILVLDDQYFTINCVAIVTGTASGIGQATALALAHNGLTVAATDMDEDGLTETEQKHSTLDLDGSVRSHARRDVACAALSDETVSATHA
jgi:3-hydroxybutyrate dehydrogenase